MIFLGKQKRQKPELLQRQSTEESYSSVTSPAKNHRRTPSWTGSCHSEYSSKSSATVATNPLDVSWRYDNDSSGTLSQGVDYLSNNKDECPSKGYAGLGSGSEDKSTRVMELIRQLSFSPSRKTKKRSNTAETEASSSCDSPDAEADYEHTKSAFVGLDLDLIEELRKGTPSPLMGLKYLPDGDMYI